MNRQDVLKEISHWLSVLVVQVRGSAAMGLTDINKLSEGFLLELFREVYQLPNLQDLNREKINFPGLDLGDDIEGRAFQITATADIGKVKEAIQTIVAHRLHERFKNKIQIYILTDRQTSYKQTSLDEATGATFSFDGEKDILDYRDLLKTCSELTLDRAQAVLEILRRHLDKDSIPEHGSGSTPYFPIGVETVAMSLVPIEIPSQIFFADHLAPALGLKAPGDGRRRRHRTRPLDPRTVVAQDILKRGLDVPEDFIVFDRQLISLRDLGQPQPVLAPYYDVGTVTPMRSSEFYKTDDDQLHAFKGLLRRALQKQASRQSLRWQHEEQLFIFVPENDEAERKVGWIGEKTAERTVFVRTMKNNKPNEILSCKHLAFRAEFLVIDGQWFISIIPDWYFSRDGYEIDRFGSDRIGWLKRKENDQQVSNHFRFIVSQLQASAQPSLFEPGFEPAIRFGSALQLDDHPYLPDRHWLPEKPRESSDSKQLTL